MSQTIEMSQCNVRYQEDEIVELKSKISELEGLIAQHKEVMHDYVLVVRSN